MQGRSAPATPRAAPHPPHCEARAIISLNRQRTLRRAPRGQRCHNHGVWRTVGFDGVGIMEARRKFVATACAGPKMRTC
eukprot:530077-Prymnesium_polylepis.3